MHVNSTRHAQFGHYRAIANELRLIVLRMKHAEAAEELRRLAGSYERLAERAAGMSYPANGDYRERCYAPQGVALAPSSDAKARPTGTRAPEVSVGLAGTSRNRVISEGDPKRLGGPQ